MITLITPTGHRPEAFALCCKYMNKQTVTDAVQWIVIDDSIGNGDAPKTAEALKSLTNPNIKAELYAGPTMWRPGLNTQRSNLEAALPFIKGDKIFIVEDEDYYHPAYLQIMSALLDLVEIVGESNSKYYFVNGPGGKEMRNFTHSSLCQTGFRKSRLPLFEEALNSGEFYIDIGIWSRARHLNVPRLLVADRNLCVGIKGMPGRPNLSAGAKQTDFLMDPSFSKLKEWIGSDFESYKQYKRVYEKRDQKGNEPRNGGRKEIYNAAKPDTSRASTQATNRRAGKAGEQRTGHQVAQSIDRRKG